jgi:hypothetical protein
VEKSKPKNLCCFFNSKKLPKDNNRTMGENSPNLVTLFPEIPVDNLHTLAGGLVFTYLKIFCHNLKKYC